MAACRRRHLRRRCRRTNLDRNLDSRLQTCRPRRGFTMNAVTRETVQQEVRDWLRANWDPQLSLQVWRERLVDAGWAVPSWSHEWFGRDLPAWADQIVADELRLIGAVGNPLGSGMSLAAPTIVEHGSDELKRLILRQTLTGEKTWCQLFSEPGAGSDLASLSSSAVLDGDEWVINGQKV
ncbi:MAG: hypothetical protein F2738_05260, partial [Actinobacteria bacterium]|nr:hypothetical protein [Actinomycetota bacterium]